VKKRKCKVFPKPRGPWAVLISVS